MTRHHLADDARVCQKQCVHALPNGASRAARNSLQLSLDFGRRRRLGASNICERTTANANKRNSKRNSERKIERARAHTLNRRAERRCSVPLPLRTDRAE